MRYLAAVLRFARRLRRNLSLGGIKAAGNLIQPCGPCLSHKRHSRIDTLRTRRLLGERQTDRTFHSASPGAACVCSHSLVASSSSI
ncbi:hypothetical protein BOSEA31B_12904 [Hyphomicrobiales bacterium]|nr:hypothetical protein BOSEA31B_12904 [Hyphomicrobiales bacterium]